MIALSALLVATLSFQDTDLRLRSDENFREIVLRTSLLESTELRIYDMSALSGHHRLQQLVSKFAPSTEASTIDEALDRFTRLDRAREHASLNTEYLLASLRLLMEPTLVDDLQDIRHLEGGKFALVGVPQQHAWLEGFLRAADEFDGLIDLEAQIFRFDAGLLNGVGERGSGYLLSEHATQELLTDLATSGIEAITTPSITTLPFQQAQLSLLNQTSYLKDYELKLLPDLNTEIADPVIDIIQSGLLLKLRAVPLANGMLGVFIDLELSKLDLPIPSADIVIGTGRHEVTVQLPQVTSIRVDGHFNVPPGETLMLTTVDPSGTSEIIVLLKTTRVVDLSESDLELPASQQEQ